MKICKYFNLSFFFFLLAFIALTTFFPSCKSATTNLIKTAKPTPVEKIRHYALYCPNVGTVDSERNVNDTTGVYMTDIEVVETACIKLKLNCERIGYQEIRAGDLIKKKYKALFMPGGNMVPRAYGDVNVYLDQRALRWQGAEKIIEFIKKGGSYVAICAGAYYASQAKNGLIWLKEDWSKPAKDTVLPNKYSSSHYKRYTHYYVDVDIDDHTRMRSYIYTLDLPVSTKGPVPVGNIWRGDTHHTQASYTFNEKHPFIDYAKKYGVPFKGNSLKLELVGGPTFFAKDFKQLTAASEINTIAWYQATYNKKDPADAEGKYDWFHPGVDWPHIISVDSYPGKVILISPHPSCKTDGSIELLEALLKYALEP